MNKEQCQGFGVYAAQGNRKVKLAMQELWLSGRVLPFGARLVVRHTFCSSEKTPLEAIYAFGLPRDAALRGFRIVGEGFDVHSELRPTEEARDAYEQGLEQGSLSALAQTYRDGLVNLSVGAIRPGEQVTVYLEIAAGVTCRDDGFRFRFPFTLAPGYHSRAAAGPAESDEGEITLPEDIFGDVLLPRWRADAEGLHRVGFDLTLALPGAEAEIASPSHTIAVQMGLSDTVRVTLAQAADVPNRDLILDARSALTTPRVFCGTDGAGKGRFAALVPSPCFGTAARQPKRVVFLIDHSGSMQGRPFDQAKQAALACIAALNPEDLFGIVFFESSTTMFPPGCVAADQQQRDAARTFISRVNTAGGTELAKGIRKAARLLPEGGDILLITDGQVCETDTIIALARKAGARVHCLGIGSASQDRFLALLARETGGASYFASPRERVDEAALRLFRGVGALAAEGLECAAENLSGAVLVPPLSPFVRVGEPLLVFGSCDGTGRGTLRFSWGGGALDIPVEIPAPAAASPDTSVAPSLGETLKLVQGARVITDLEVSGDVPGEMARTAKRRAKLLDSHWRRLAEEYGLANPGMALVAVVERPGDQAGVLPTTCIVPVGMPQDTGFDAYFGWAGHKRSMEHHLIDCAMAMPNVVMSCSMPYGRDSASADSGREFAVEESAEFQALDQATNFMFALASVLEADGGLPGSTPDERIARTLAGLVLMLDFDHHSETPLFDVHAGRMTGFLRGAAGYLPSQRAALVNRVLGDAELQQGIKEALSASAPDPRREEGETLWDLFESVA